jgi:hypothetical protein
MYCICQFALNNSGRHEFRGVLGPLFHTCVTLSFLAVCSLCPFTVLLPCQLQICSSVLCQLSKYDLYRFTCDFFFRCQSKSMQIWVRLTWIRQVLAQYYVCVPQLTGRVPENALAGIDPVIAFCM